MNIFIESFEKHFTYKHYETTFIPCAIVENVIFNEIADKQNKRNKLKEISNWCTIHLGLVKLQKHIFVEYLEEYYPIIPENIKLRLEKQCKNTTSRIDCYLGVSCKNNRLHNIQSILIEKVEKLQQFIYNNPNINGLYNIHKKIVRLENELYYNTNSVIIEHMPYYIDKNSLVIYRDNISVGNTHFMYLDDYFDLYSDYNYNTIDIEQSQIIGKIQVMSIDKTSFYSKYIFIKLDNILKKYIDDRLQDFEENGIKAIILADNDYYILINSSNDYRNLYTYKTES